MASSGKKTKGKQKIDMKIIEKEDEKLVTFSKRRSRIYKKISEITILCGTNILFICFSPAAFLVFFEVDWFGKASLVVDSDFQVFVQSDAAIEKQKLLAQQTSGSEPNLRGQADIEKLSLQELEDLDSRYTEHINGLYSTISKKVAATINANEESL
ncbi:hypothetical protein V6N11_079075 [Hibiscus sabdariffa]|uniref:MADS-box domain-containing protein n=1 Tax=Hibiscus sabdariffa TaxID=183260 RepID=A0ABR2RUP0_9ROSI